MTQETQPGDPASAGATTSAWTAMLEAHLEQVRAAGRYKREVVITTPQGSNVDTGAGPLLNLCANNYLGLASHPDVIAAAHRALDERGAGMASVRFICGTQDRHRELEQAIARFLGYEDAILYNSCFDANVGLFQPLATLEDVILSDALNHASIIDGTRLAKARRVVYRHNDMADLEAKLAEARDARTRIIATDGVFSMEGELALLPEIVALAEAYGALVVVDDSHGVGAVGARGRGTVAHLDTVDGVVLQTGTFGKALGGASGGYVVGTRAAIDVLRQESRPYLFSNALPPAITGAALAALRLLEADDSLPGRLHANTDWFRTTMAETGFEIVPAAHPIVAVMIGDEQRALDLAEEIRSQGVMVVAFTFPVVPVGAARIRVQISAAHTLDDLQRAVDAFASAGRKLGLI
jgi:glycine C-acetyltransferase